jgi:hypothetical protein
MSKTFTLNQLTEGIRQRNVGADGLRLIEKWTRTGLLRGLDEQRRETMSRLLENQASQLLREANSVSSGAGGLSSSGDLQGFTNIAFPIVRRVFGGLVANELVSIQPMSLPSGLLFYLDYTYGSDVGGNNDLNSDNTELGSVAATYSAGNSIYGGPAGASIREGANAAGGQYDLVGTAYTKIHSASEISNIAASGSYTAGGLLVANGVGLSATGSDGKLLQFDVQLSRQINDGTGAYSALIFDATDSDYVNFDVTNAKSFALHSSTATEAGTAEGGLCTVGSDVQDGRLILNVRRLNQIGSYDSSSGVWTSNPFIASASRQILCIVSGVLDQPALNEAQLNLTASYAIADKFDGTSFDSGATLTIPSFESNFGGASGGDPDPVIPEIDIKIESIAVTATTRKLRARWSPELAQDLNAYHSLDAEVELTQILSEQIALEIDREILNDLLVEARGANYYWSRAPGKFINKTSGTTTGVPSSASFTGTVREWYETLVETIIDVANEIHRKTLRGSANFIVCSPEVATIFEASVLYKPSLKIDGQGQVSGQFSLGAAAIGSLSNRFTVYKDPYFPRNKILVGYKGGSYLETGYVYAPYVPLIVTPTIFAPEDFTPRKGVMTRYGKKMVRADFYGTVTCLDMDVI